MNTYIFLCRDTTYAILNEDLYLLTFEIMLLGCFYAGHTQRKQDNSPGFSTFVLKKEVSRGPVPDLETQGLGVRHCRIPRHFPMSGSGSSSTFLCPVFHVCNW